MREWAGQNKYMHRRAASMEKRAERIRKTEKPPSEKQLKAAFSEKDFHGDEVFRLHQLSKCFGEKRLFENVSVKLKGGERVAVLGPNGSGKTTLLKILIGDESYTGNLWLGPAVRTGYLPQLVRFSNPERSLVDTLLYELDCSVQEARNRLGAFGFPADDVFKTVEKLSGGERSRLKLCLLMAQPINLLILDEPTNHLDLSSREWIETVLDSYDGTIVFVSHDRAFIKRFANRIWAMENGTVTDYHMGYEKYREQTAKTAARRPPGNDSPGETREAVPPAAEKANGKKDAALLRQNNAKARVLEKRLDELETRLTEIEALFERHACDANELQNLLNEQINAAAERDDCYEKWLAVAE
jgi:ATPase subunit of ABC transporter with duplicated ATPase domains